MQIHNRIYLVGSGDTGIGISHSLDCTVYLLDGGSQRVLIDAGVGIDYHLILQNICADGFDPKQIDAIYLTHGHGDHAGGAAQLARECGAQIYAMQKTADFVRRGDLCALSITPAIEAGVYPPNFQFEACPVIPLTDNQSFSVGDLTVSALLTEGHCTGHACYQLVLDGETVLFSGDSVFHGGKITLQNIWDCDIQRYLATCRRLAQLHPDAFLPSHGAFSMHRGYLHLQRAIEKMNALGVPSNTI